MRKEDKATVIEQITATLKEYSHIYLTETTTLNAEKTSNLRRECFKNDIKLLVVRDDCNIRTDKWALAMAAMDRVNNYKLNEYLKKGEAEAPKTAESQPEGGVTEPNPTRDN